MAKGIVLPNESRKLGSRIEELRKERDLTRQQLAEAVGVSRISIYHYENARYPITVEKLLLVSRALGTTIDYFLMDLDLDRMR